MNSQKPTLRNRLAQRVNEYYTLGEEIANGITHGIGAALSVAGLILLMVLAVSAGDVRHVVAFAVYGTSLILLYLASTLYHSLHHPDWRLFLRKFDHACIYILIAGTYTPFLLINLDGSIGMLMLALIWGVALVGIIFKTIFIHRFEVASTLAYVGMGWLVVLVWEQMVANVPPEAITWLAVGGASYTLGVIFYAMQKLPYNHAIWHLFVLGGSISHFVAVLYIAPWA